MSRKILVSALLFLFGGSVVMASAGPPLEPLVTSQVQAAARSFIQTQTIDGAFLYYDASQDEVRHLEFKMLYPVVGQEGDHYVVGADFFDQQGRPVSLKFIVIMHGSQPQMLQAVVSTIAGDSSPPCADHRAS
jgi:hypothetical protein